MGNGFSWSRGSERQVAHTEQILTQVTPPGNISQVDVPSQGANTICVCKGRTIRYVMGGGRGILEPQVFFPLSNSLYEFF